MEGLNSPVGSREEIKYSHIQDNERGDCNNSVQQKEPKSRSWLLIFLLSVNCFALIALLISTSQLGSSQSSICSNMNDVGSNLLPNDDLSIINSMATPYHYLEPGFDDDDFIVGDPYWAELFPGAIP
jgi:hypothetical protein